MQDSSQGVVVLARNGIELVIVAAGTAYCEPKDGLAECINLFVDAVRPFFHGVLFGKNLGSDGKETGGGQGRASGIGTLLVAEKITRNLLAKKLIVGQVTIEGANDIVAIMVRVWVGMVFIAPVRVGVARHIKPMPSPPFPVCRKRE